MKRSLNIVLLGHVDCGKSTFGGHLLYKLGEVKQITIEKFEREAEWLGKGSFKYSWILSKLKTERERGITIQPSCGNFDSGKYDVTLIDVPGHRDFIKNALSGMSLADVGILIIDASKGGFETGISRNGQTIEHLICSFAYAIKQMLVLVNKMDDQSVNFSERRFDEIVSELTKAMKRIGYNPKKVPIIPISSWLGFNLTEPTPANFMSWWKKGKTKWGGMTFLQALNTMKSPKRKIRSTFPLRIPILNVFKISGIGYVLTGTISTGTISVGQEIYVSPQGKSFVVGSLEKHHKSIEKAFPGDLVGVHVKGKRLFLCFRGKDRIRRGNMIGDAKDNPPKVVDLLEVRLLNYSHPNFRAGFEPVMDCRTYHMNCKIMKILSRIEKKTGEVIDENPKGLKKGELGRVLISCREKRTENKILVTEPFDTSDRLLKNNMGRFILRDNRQVIGIGIIQKVFKKDKGWVSLFGLSNFDSDLKERMEYVKDEGIINDWADICGIKLCFLGYNFFVWKSLLL